MSGWGVEQPSLPPHHLWLIQPGEKIDTPIDSREIVDIPKTIKLVKSLVDPSYKWKPELSVHHFEYPAYLYPYEVRPNGVNLQVFRNLPPNKGYMPREFENFLHAVTLPPPVPEDDVMHYRVEGWRVASSLFKNARKVLHCERLQRRRREGFLKKHPELSADSINELDPIGEEIMQSLLERNFRGVDMHLSANDRIPAEFRFFDSEAPLTHIVASLGQIIVPNSIQLTKAVPVN